MRPGIFRWMHFAALFCVLAVCAPDSADARRKRDKQLEQSLRSQIEILASDDFAGREPGTEGEAKTLRYLARRWFEVGLVSGTNDPGNEWFAPVTLVAREPAVSVTQFTLGKRMVQLDEEEALMLTSGKRSLLQDAPLLFVGNGDGTGISRNELAGRVALMLDGEESGSERQNALLAQGASAVITILHGERTLEQVAARRQRSGYALSQDSVGGDLEGFVTRDAMQRVLALGRSSVAALEEEAARSGFMPRIMKLGASLEATSRETTIRTHNLLGRLPGKQPEAGAVMLVAHWDHFGVCGEQTAEDRICNGAIDNASGLAFITEVAARLARGPRLDRDVYFLATTAEELGLLGAHAFADNPPMPLGQIVAALNIDSVAIAPRGTPLAIVGRGMTGLDDTIAEVANREKRKLIDNDEANEFVRRQDGWALIQHDIPAVMVTSAYGDIERIRKFFDTDYHRPSDDLGLPLELGGAAEDVEFHLALVRWLGDAAKFSPADKSP
jgi:hypothetical protein